MNKKILLSLFLVGISNFVVFSLENPEQTGFKEQGNSIKDEFKKITVILKELLKLTESGSKSKRFSETVVLVEQLKIDVGNFDQILANYDPSSVLVSGKENLEKIFENYLKSIKTLFSYWTQAFEVDVDLLTEKKGVSSWSAEKKQWYKEKLYDLLIGVLNITQGLEPIVKKFFSDDVITGQYASYIKNQIQYLETGKILLEPTVVVEKPEFVVEKPEFSIEIPYAGQPIILDPYKEEYYKTEKGISKLKKESKSTKTTKESLEETVGESLGRIGKLVTGSVQTGWEKTKEGASTISSKVSSGAEAVAQGVKHGASTAVQGAKHGAGYVGGTIRSGAESIYEKIPSFGGIPSFSSQKKEAQVQQTLTQEQQQAVQIAMVLVLSLQAQLEHLKNRFKSLDPKKIDYDDEINRLYNDIENFIKTIPVTTSTKQLLQEAQSLKKEIHNALEEETIRESIEGLKTTIGSAASTIAEKTGAKRAAAKIGEFAFPKPAVLPQNEYLYLRTKDLTYGAGIYNPFAKANHTLKRDGIIYKYSSYLQEQFLAGKGLSETNTIDLPNVFKSEISLFESILQKLSNGENILFESDNHKNSVINCIESFHMLEDMLNAQKPISSKIIGPKIINFQLAEQKSLGFFKSVPQGQSAIRSGYGIFGYETKGLSNFYIDQNNILYTYSKKLQALSGNERIYTNIDISELEIEAVQNMLTQINPKTYINFDQNQIAIFIKLMRPANLNMVEVFLDQTNLELLQEFAKPSGNQ